MMYGATCSCFHHPIMKGMGLVGAVTVFGFFVSLFLRGTFLSFSLEQWFMACVVLALAMHGMKFCPCHRHHMMTKEWMEGGMKEGMKE